MLLIVPQEFALPGYYYLPELRPKVYINNRETAPKTVLIGRTECFQKQKYQGRNVIALQEG